MLYNKQACSYRVNVLMHNMLITNFACAHMIAIYVLAAEQESESLVYQAAAHSAHHLWLTAQELHTERNNLLHELHAIETAG
eukprot:2074-Heterococcus_DN1.PRE.1